MSAPTPQVWILRYREDDPVARRVFEAVRVLMHPEAVALIREEAHDPGLAVLHYGTEAQLASHQLLSRLEQRARRSRMLYRVIYSLDPPADGSGFDKELEWLDRDGAWMFARKLADQHEGCAVQEITFDKEDGDGTPEQAR